MVFTGAAVNSPARKNSARATASRWSELTRSSESAIARTTAQACTKEAISRCSP